MKKYFNYNVPPNGIAIKTYVIDLFCGAGGTSTAIFESQSNIQVIACINHDENAIRSHSENYPECIHYTEDIRTVSLSNLKKLITHLKLEDPYCKIAIWASLECTHFSKAKGGQSRDADSRTLAEHLFRYQKVLDPDFFWIENVREFLTWGPLDKHGKPAKQFKGCDYEKWVSKFKELGYHYDYRLLNAADYGAFTSRVRYFGQFSKNANHIAWPTQTHFKKPKLDQKPWKAVKEVLDFTDEGVSIFNRKKRLSDATFERIYAGLVKFIADGDDTFLKKYFSGRPEGKVLSTNSPAGTITCRDHHALVKVDSFIKRYNGGNPQEKVSSIDNVIGTISTNGRHAIVKCDFLCSYYKNSTFIKDNEPCGTLTTKDRFSKVNVTMIDNQYGKSKPTSADQPIGTLTAIPKQSVITAETIQKHHYLMNPQYSSKGSSIQDPCFTLIARTDKSPPYFITAENADDWTLDLNNFFDILDTYSFHDSYYNVFGPLPEKSIRVKIIDFMIAYGIKDIKMRMLQILEMLQIQGFPKDYILKGTQTEQKKYIGNSVEVTVGVALFRAIDTKIQQVNYLMVA